jgi:hypothetical protein
MGRELLGVRLKVQLIQAPSSVGTIAKYSKDGDRKVVYLNVSHPALPDFEAIWSADVSPGEAWYDVMERWDNLLIHELSHEKVEAHWGSEILDEATRLGAKLKQLALKEPHLFGKRWLCREFE